MSRKERETDRQCLDSLIKHRNFNKTAFKKYLVEDCLFLLKEHSGDREVDSLIKLIEKWLRNPRFVNIQEFRNIADLPYTEYSFFPLTRHIASIVVFAVTLTTSIVARHAAHVWSIHKDTENNKFKQYIRFAKKYCLNLTSHKTLSLTFLILKQKKN